MNKIKILIIDDDLDLLASTRLFLESNNYEVNTAINTKIGSEVLMIFHPDLIILDLMLPKIDGYKVCRMLKFDKKYNKIPIIIFTAKMQESDKKIGLEVGADAYIAKPFQHEEVLSKIKELLA